MSENVRAGVLFKCGNIIMVGETEGGARHTGRLLIERREQLRHTGQHPIEGREQQRRRSVPDRGNGATAAPDCSLSGTGAAATQVAY